jgi:hypothetical protein
MAHSQRPAASTLHAVDMRNKRNRKARLRAGHVVGGLTVTPRDIERLDRFRRRHAV